MLFDDEFLYTITPKILIRALGLDYIANLQNNKKIIKTSKKSKKINLIILSVKTRIYSMLIIQILDYEFSFLLLHIFPMVFN